MQGMIEMMTPACSMPQSVAPMLVLARTLTSMIGTVKRRLLVHEDQRREELVPRGDEGEQRDGDDRRHDRGRKMRRSTCKRVAAVDHRRLLELARDRLEAVAHQVDR